MVAFFCLMVYKWMASWSGTPPPGTYARTHAQTDEQLKNIMPPVLA